MTHNQDIHYFSFPTHIFFGIGSRKKLGSILHEQNCSRPLLVTDRGLAPLPLTKEIIEDVKSSPHTLSLGVFSEIWGNPLRTHVIEGIKTYRSHKADSIIALGGGAALDVAKAISLMVHHPGDLFDYEEENPKCRPFDQPIPFLLALPTTAGTGSEVGRSSVISDEKTKRKKIIFSEKLLPKIVLTDPELTRDLPTHITAATGMDALTHLVEAYLSKGFHPLCDGIALEGIKLVHQSLRDCVHKGKDLEKRGLLMMASMMGAIAFQKGLGVTHSCAHALSTVYDLHHGLANGILISYCMEFNSDCNPEKFSYMANLLEAPKPSPKGFIKALEELKKDIGIPKHLKEVGVHKKDLNQLIKIAHEDTCHQLNPKRVSKNDFQNIFSNAIG